MNKTPQARGKASRLLGRILSIGIMVACFGIASNPVNATGVTVDSSPLIVQASLPPNIVLMLDDSGSMDYDYMPDWSYLTNRTTDGVRDSANNGTYYNPTVTYVPPPKADGSSYPNSPDIGTAYSDGFTDQSATDVTTFTGSYNYYTRFTITTSSTYNPTSTQTPTCPSGYSLVNAGTSGNPNYQCNKNKNPNKDTRIQPTYVTTYSCDQGGTLDSNNKCVVQNSSYKYYFTYTTGSAAGPYTQHYVGKSGDCALLPSASQAVCDDSAAVRQNVANWFSYYRTRMQMAKSGLMTAFSTVNPGFRVGFGSINNNNSNGVKATGKYTSSYNSKYIAQVQPFGTGASGTQKAYFWSWVNDIAPNNGTPLRLSLDAVGQYYGSSQPWSTMSSDPSTADPNTELACRQSYAILTTDGFWNGNTPSNIGNQDGAAGTTISGTNGQTYKYVAAAPYSDAQSDTLADVAMKYWKKDLRTTTNNEVPVSTEDGAFWQHMSTFTLGLGFTPTGISPSGTSVDDIFNWATGGSAISNFSWPTPSSDSINNIADLAHAAVNGHGGFYSATSPQAFASGLKDALKRASERVGTGASLAANSTQLQTGTVAYQANYYTAKWKGDLKAFAVNSTDGSISTTPSWIASSVLPSAASRNIYTYNPSAPATSQYVAFKTGTGGSLPVLSGPQNTALSTLGSGTTSEADMISYLRGDASKEQQNSGAYRNRDTALGDIVDSQPVYVGAPDPNQFYNETFTGSTSFATYASTKASRTGLIYVAANDGMLHAFNASTGVEVYAYLPGAVITSGTAGTSGLTALADPAYGTDSVPHQYFNDGEMAVADAYVGSSWKTILVGTTGRGLARAVYALDVTDPTAIKFLWERSASDGLTDSTYIGQMTGKPVIAQVADGSWAVLMGNGYNSGAGKSALLQFALADGTMKVYQTTDASGLAAPAVWMDPSGNGVSTIAYAGDADGNVWSFALDSGTVTKLYTALDSSSHAQPITAGMLIGKDPQTGNVWLFFGTGRYLASADLKDLSTQTWYGLVVQTSDSTNRPAVTSSKTRADLAKRTITAEVAASASTLAARTVTAATDADSMTGKSGWYIDLLSPTGLNGAGVNQGERMVTPNQFQGNLLLGVTRIPQASDLCNPSGIGWIMAVDPFTGTNPSSSFFDLNGDGVIDSNDLVNGKPAAGVGFTSLPNNPIFVGSTMLTSFDNGTTSSLKTSNTTGQASRISWRELINQ